MKAKLLIVFLVLLSAFMGCKDKDSVSAANKYLSYVDNDDGVRLIEFEYDEQKRMKKINVFLYQDPVEIRIVYDEQGRVKDCFLETVQVGYQYNANGVLSGFTFMGGTVGVYYDPVVRKYTLSLGGSTYNYYFDEKGHLIRVEDLNLLYDNGKGPLHNVDIPPALTLAPYGVFLDVFVENNFLSAPLESILGGSGSNPANISFENTYEKDGFLKRSLKTVKSYESGQLNMEMFSYNYHYISLK